MGSLPKPSFLALFGTSLADKIGFPCTNKASQTKVNAQRLPICISLCAGCAAPFCNQIFLSHTSLYMVPQHYHCSASWWSNGMDPVRLIGSHWFSSESDFFVAFFVTCLGDKIGFPCTNKACHKKMNAYRLPIRISLCAGWVCSSPLQPNFRVSVYRWSLIGTMVLQAGGLVLCTVCC